MVSQIARNEGGSKVWASDKCAVNEAAVLAAAGPEHTSLAKRVMTLFAHVPGKESHGNGKGVHETREARCDAPGDVDGGQVAG